MRSLSEYTAKTTVSIAGVQKVCERSRLYLWHRRTAKDVRWDSQQLTYRCTASAEAAVDISKRTAAGPAAARTH